MKKARPHTTKWKARSVAVSDRSSGKTPEAAEESPDERRRRLRAILRELKVLYPEAECALHHASAFQLLVATILSAQCTDERVNQATPELFSRYPDAEALARSNQDDVERIVRPLGFFRNKSANIRAMAGALVERHGGDVPQIIDQLVKLPGVGRKTASVVLGTWFGIPSGVVVDTHVRRISSLLGLTASQNPEIIERELMELLPRSEWIMFSHRLIHHGRRICVARRPACPRCTLIRHCRRVGLSPLAGHSQDDHGDS